MGGLKHQVWGSIIPGQGPDLTKIQDPLKRHEAMFSSAPQPFCKLCGKVIIMASQDEHGAGVDWKEEQRIEMHTACKNEEIERRKAEEWQKKQEPQESLEDIIKRQYGMDARKYDE